MQGGSADQTIVDNPTGEVPPSPTSSGGVYNQQSSGNTSSTGSTTSANVSPGTGSGVTTQVSSGDYTSYATIVTPPTQYTYEGYSINNAIANYFGTQGGTNVGPFNLSAYATATGAFIRINYMNPGGTLPFFRSYQWIQTVSTSGEFEKYWHVSLPMPHIDGAGIETGTLENPPFYYTNFQLQTQALPLFSNYTSSFHDFPRGETWFDGEVTLVGIDFAGRLTPLGTFSWGYVLTKKRPLQSKNI